MNMQGLLRTCLILQAGFVVKSIRKTNMTILKRKKKQFIISVIDKCDVKDKNAIFGHL